MILIDPPPPAPLSDEAQQRINEAHAATGQPHDLVRAVVDAAWEQAHNPVLDRYGDEQTVRLLRSHLCKARHWLDLGWAGDAMAWLQKAKELADEAMQDVRQQLRAMGFDFANRG